MLIKKASDYTTEEKAALGITGIPENWPVEKMDTVGPIPDGFKEISEQDFLNLKANNQASYDAWLAALRPIITPAAPAPTQVIVQSSPSFGSKTLLVGTVTKKLYARNTGIQKVLTQGENTLSFVIAYPWIKFVGVEVVNCEALDIVNLKILDNAQGSYSGVPNLVLNQFSYAHNLPKDYYIRMSQYDADLYAGMTVEVLYTSVSAKTVGINFIMNEVK